MTRSPVDPNFFLAICLGWAPSGVLAYNSPPQKKMFRHNITDPSEAMCECRNESCILNCPLFLTLDALNIHEMARKVLIEIRVAILKFLKLKCRNRQILDETTTYILNLTRSKNLISSFLNQGCLTER